MTKIDDADWLGKEMLISTIMRQIDQALSDAKPCFIKWENHFEEIDPTTNLEKLQNTLAGKNRDELEDIYAADKPDEGFPVIYAADNEQNETNVYDRFFERNPVCTIKSYGDFVRRHLEEIGDITMESYRALLNHLNFDPENERHKRIIGPLLDAKKFPALQAMAIEYKHEQGEKNRQMAEDRFIQKTGKKPHQVTTLDQLCRLATNGSRSPISIYADYLDALLPTAPDSVVFKIILPLLEDHEPTLTHMVEKTLNRLGIVQTNEPPATF